MKNILTWSPRILALMFAGFIALFALDAFSTDIPFGTRLFYFLIHLLPSVITLLILWIAWKHRIFGGLLFMVLGLLFTIYFSTWKEASYFLLISLPLFVVGLLFIVSKWDLPQQAPE